MARLALASLVALLSVSPLPGCGDDGKDAGPVECTGVTYQGVTGVSASCSVEFTGCADGRSYVVDCGSVCSCLIDGGEESTYSEATSFCSRVQPGSALAGRMSAANDACGWNLE